MVGVSSRVSRMSFQVRAQPWISIPSGVQGGGSRSSTPSLDGHILVVQSTIPADRAVILSQSLSWNLGCHFTLEQNPTTGSEMTILLPLHEVPSGGKSRLIPAHALWQRTAFALGIEKQVFIRHHPLSRTGLV